MGASCRVLESSPTPARLSSSTLYPTGPAALEPPREPHSNRERSAFGRASVAEWTLNVGSSSGEPCGEGERESDETSGSGDNQVVCAFPVWEAHNGHPPSSTLDISGARWQI